MGTSTNTRLFKSSEVWNIKFKDEAAWMAHFEFKNSAYDKNDADSNLIYFLINPRMASVELEATSNAKNLKTRFNSASEVTSFLTRFMGCIQRSRSALVNPKKRTLEELRNSKNVVRFNIRFICYLCRTIFLLRFNEIMNK